ncbi:pyruvate dehydrogenase (acetyl-transferring) E1 component subunit alpha [Candidatus Micrarchaeota archaeon]|nr:pyruvate dehydrogenase (acetyl-transferring) E1 component subunit alpha [Candidatus Micrarchaeota archaeon]
MSRKKVFEAQIEYLQILDEKGNVDASLDPKLDELTLKKMYETMVRSRAMDKKAISLQRQGRCYTYVPTEGQEAAQVGSVMASKKEDWMVPAFRENAAYLAKGVSMRTLFLYWMGHEEGSRFEKDQNCFPVSIPVGSQVGHAVGLAWAAKIQGKRQAAITFFGDGASSEGDFHESANFAGVFQIPCVFICQNNQYAISTPRARQTRSETIAQKAIAYGFEGIQVDGNDVLAMYVATKKALEKGYAGKGPTLIEAITYRIAAHTTSDDPKRYRDEAEVEAWRKKDPIARFQTYLKKNGFWNEAYEKEVQEKAAREVEEAVKKAEGFQANPEDMFKYLYQDLTPDLRQQMQEMKQSLEG